MSASTSPAAEDAWSILDVADGAALDLVEISRAQPSRFFASGAGGGIYRSDNWGGDWTWAGEGLPHDREVTALAASRFHADVAFAATTAGSVHRSTDAGATWTDSGAGLAGDVVRAVAFHPWESSIVYAGTAGGVGRGFFRSTDGGDTWAPRGNGLLSAEILAIESHPGDGSLLLVGTPDGIARSTDGSATWSWVLPGPSAHRLDWNWANPNRVHAHAGGLRVSTDAGATWAAVAAPLFDDFAAHPIDPLVLMVARGRPCYSGGTAGCGYPFPGSLVHRTSNAGATWETVLSTCDCHTPGSIVFDPNATDRVYLPGSSGMLRSDTAGDEWEFTNGGLHMVPVHAVDADPAGKIYVRSDELHASSDEGASWAALDVPIGWDTPVPTRLEVSSQRVGWLLESGIIPSKLSQYYVARSSDGGATWGPEFLDEGLSNSDPIRLAVSNHGSGDVVYAWVEFWDELYRSDDGGSTYVFVGDAPLAIDAVVDSGDSEHLFAIVEGTQPVIESTDGGLTWTAASDGLPTTGEPIRILLDPDAPGHLLVAFRSGAPYESVDGGDAWTVIDAPSGNFTVSDAAWDVSGSPRQVFLATDEGVWLSANGFVNEGLESFEITSIAYDEANQALLVGTQARGAFVRDVPSVASTSAPDPVVAEASHLGIAPNPWRRSTQVRFTMDRAASRARLDVYDAAGRRIRTLIDAPLSPGPQTVTWDGRRDDGVRVAAGVYFLRLETPARSWTKRAVVVR